MERCVFCQAELEPGARLCRQCGRAQPSGPLAAPPASSSSTALRCPKCGQAVQLDDRFCRQCAQSLARRCQTCGTIALEADRFCANCAQPLGQPLEQQMVGSSYGRMPDAGALAADPGFEALMAPTIPGMPSQFAPTIPLPPASLPGGVPITNSGMPPAAMIRRCRSGTPAREKRC